MTSPTSATSQIYSKTNVNNIYRGSGVDLRVVWRGGSNRGGSPPAGNPKIGRFRTPVSALQHLQNDPGRGSETGVNFPVGTPPKSPMTSPTSATSQIYSKTNVNNIYREGGGTFRGGPLGGSLGGVETTPNGVRNGGQKSRWNPPEISHDFPYICNTPNIFQN